MTIEVTWYNFHLDLDRISINHITMIWIYEEFIINYLKLFHENVHLKTITGTQISRNLKINCHSIWERLPTPPVIYYRQLQESNGRICESQLELEEYSRVRLKIYIFWLSRSLVPSWGICLYFIKLYVSLKHQTSSMHIVDFIKTHRLCLYTEEYTFLTNRLDERTDDFRVYQYIFLSGTALVECY